MNRFCMIACAVAVAAADLAAAELQTLWWSKRLNAPERFDRNSSGRVTVSRDEAEQAVRFDVEFTSGSIRGSVSGAASRLPELTRSGSNSRRSSRGSPAVTNMLI